MNRKVVGCILRGPDRGQALWTGTGSKLPVITGKLGKFSNLTGKKHSFAPSPTFEGVGVMFPISRFLRIWN